MQQPAEEPDDRLVRIEERRVFELVQEPGRQARTRAELLEQIRADAGRVEEAFELRGGELADLLLGVINAAFVADAPADLAHDLLDVDRVGADGEI